MQQQPMQMHREQADSGDQQAVVSVCVVSLTDQHLKINFGRWNFRPPLDFLESTGIDLTLNLSATKFISVNLAMLKPARLILAACRVSNAPDQPARARPPTIGLSTLGAPPKEAMRTRHAGREMTYFCVWWLVCRCTYRIHPI